MEKIPSSENRKSAEESELRKKVLSGDRPAYAKLVEFYYHFIKHIAKIFFQKKREFFHAEDAEDLAQNVMLRLESIVRNYENSDQQISFQNYMVGCVRFIAADMVKRMRRWNFSRGEEDRAQSEDECSWEKTHVRREIMKLNDQNQMFGQVLIDYYWVGLGDSEIADKLDLTKNRVWKIRQKALREIGECLKSESRI